MVGAGDSACGVYQVINMNVKHVLIYGMVVWDGDVQAVYCIIIGIKMQTRW